MSHIVSINQGEYFQDYDIYIVDKIAKGSPLK
jgi:hypothetical protein